MKKIIVSSFVIAFSILFITPLFAQKKTSQAVKKQEKSVEKGALFFDQTTIDIGKIEDREEPYKVVYTFKNIGKGPITIKGVTMLCNCLSSEWSKEPIKFNEEGKITIYYHPENQSGSQLKSFKVFTDGDPIETTLKLLAFVNDENAQRNRYFIAKQGNLSFTRYDLNYENIYAQSADTLEVGIYNPTNKVMTVHGFKNPPHIIVNAPKKIILPKSSIAVQFIYSAIAANDYGNKLEEVLMFTNDSLFPQKKFLVRANLVEDFSALTPEELKKAPVFSAITPTITLDTVPTRSSATATFIVTNKGKAPMYIRKVYGTCGCTDIVYNSDAPIKRGKKAKILVTYNTKSDIGIVSKKIVVITNTPDKPVNELELKANVVYKKRK